MKVSRLLPITLCFCAAAALLRLWQALTAFDADTGLSAAGHPAPLLLAAVLIAAAVLLFFLTAPAKGQMMQANSLVFGKPQPRDAAHEGTQADSAPLSLRLRGPLMLGSALFLASALLIAADRLPVLFTELQGGALFALFSNFGVVYVPLFTAVVLGCSGGVLLRALRGRADAVPAPVRTGKVQDGLRAALPGFGCCMLLVAVYQQHANDPAVQGFLWPEVALFCAMLAWYALSGLWYAPCSRRTLVWCCLTAAVTQCGALCAPAGAFSPAVLLVLIGNLLCFLALGARMLQEQPEG